MPLTAGAVSPSYWPGGLPLTIRAIGSKNCQTTDIKWTIYQEKYTLHISSMIPCPFSPMFAIVLFLIPQFVLIGLEASNNFRKTFKSYSFCWKVCPPYAGKLNGLSDGPGLGWDGLRGQERPHSTLMAEVTMKTCPGPAQSVYCLL